MGRTVRALLVVLGPMWSAIQVVRGFRGLSMSSLTQGRLESGDLLLLVNCAMVTTWLALLLELALHRREMRASGDVDPNVRRSPFRRGVLWALGITTATSGVGGQVAVPQPQATVPVGALVTPAVAGSVLSQILLRRREQMRIRSSPGRLSEEEMDTAKRLVCSTAITGDRSAPSVTLVTTREADALMAAVDRIDAPIEVTRTTTWEVMVKVFGYPSVVSVGGVDAQFRKKKALELLVWLVLNKDRMRRSAARTSLWDFAVTDSTFSTVISDMRRALTGLGGGQVHQHWVPPTYSDIIPLSPAIVSDYELLKVAHSRFRTSGTHAQELANLISEIRDIPFAGTNYLWADIDGTTTRLVIAALDACRDLAMWAVEQDRRSELDVAVSAALRVMPGCDEFLEIQNQYLASTYSYRRAVRR